MRIRVDMSPASTSYRNADLTDLASDGETVDFPPADPSQPGELPLTAGLIAAFKQSLSSRRINVRFFHGAWDSFVVASPYDIVLTSETIYRQDSLPSLVDLLQRASCGAKQDSRPLEELTQEQLTINASAHENGSEVEGEGERICLVAAKSVYFGVGGGATEFIRAIGELTLQSPNSISDSTRRSGDVETVWEHSEGVKRRVMRVRWR